MSRASSLNISINIQINMNFVTKSHLQTRMISLCLVDIAIRPWQRAPNRLNWIGISCGEKRFRDRSWRKSDCNSLSLIANCFKVTHSHSVSHKSSCQAWRLTDWTDSYRFFFPSLDGGQNAWPDRLARTPPQGQNAQAWKMVARTAMARKVMARTSADQYV